MSICTHVKVVPSDQAHELEKGFSLIMYDGAFKLVFKAVDGLQENELTKALLHVDIRNHFLENGIKNMALNGTIGVRYCPWCGEKLSVD